MQPNLDDIAANLPSVEVRIKKKVLQYIQKMQSRYGSRKFTLYTHQLNDGNIRLELIEVDKNDDVYMIGTRNSKRDEQSIHKAIKSLERKAKCKLYYVLLISTDGEYL